MKKKSIPKVLLIVALAGLSVSCKKHDVVIKSSIANNTNEVFKISVLFQDSHDSTYTINPGLAEEETLLAESGKLSDYEDDISIRPWWISEGSNIAIIYYISGNDTVSFAKNIRSEVSWIRETEEDGKGGTITWLFDIDSEDILN
ncbi:MAG: hypothetical protein KKA07_12100 [Bacteroidetes bacterium]|nr:hypothetical protein [Bacteroidota bacterium]MBU1719800.1 hypothetical protein [Bacteroidota bacterium]